MLIQLIKLTAIVNHFFIENTMRCKFFTKKINPGIRLSLFGKSLIIRRYFKDAIEKYFGL
jgi:hypothetical protein